MWRRSPLQQREAFAKGVKCRGMSVSSPIVLHTVFTRCGVALALT